jgi:hypothetical protein
MYLCSTLRNFIQSITKGERIIINIKVDIKDHTNEKPPFIRIIIMFIIVYRFKFLLL